MVYYEEKASWKIWEKQYSFYNHSIDTKFSRMHQDNRKVSLGGISPFVPGCELGQIKSHLERKLLFLRNLGHETDRENIMSSKNIFYEAREHEESSHISANLCFPSHHWLLNKEHHYPSKCDCLARAPTAVVSAGMPAPTCTFWPDKMELHR